MSKNFTIRSLFRPAKARAKELQGLNVEGSVSVTSTTVGVPTQSAYQTVQNITNNYTTEVVGKDNYKGRINITDLLALTDVGANDMYLVYSSGSDESGWGTADFTLNGETCKSGTFVQSFPEMSIDDDGKPVVVQSWRPVEQEQVKVDGSMKLDPMQKDLILIESTYNATSYDNLYGRSIGGLPIARVKVYELGGDTYKPKMVETTGTYAGQTNIKTIVVPYARSYQSGGETVYKGGALSDADYEQLMKGGGSIDLPIDSVMPSNPSDERVPSSKLVKTELAGKANASHSHSAGDITSGTLPVSRGGTGQTTLNLACNSLINSLHEGSSAPADSDFIICQYVGGGTTNTNYYRKPVSALWSYIKSKIDATSVQCDWSETDSNSSAYIKNKPTNVSAFTNDAGYLTSHQSLAEYTKKSDLPMSFAFAKRFINTLTTGWIPVCNITLNPTYLCDSSTAVRIARYRYNNNNYVDTTLRIQLRFQSDSYWVAFVSSTSTKNYAYKYAYSINENVVTIYTYIDNDRYIMLEAYADDYDSTCTYTANTSSAVASGVTEIVDSQTPAEVSVYCGLDYSATNKGLYVTINTLAYWNGLAATGHSNLLYCDRGRFGTIVTKSKDDYSLAGHTHDWSSITDRPDMDEYVKKTDLIANYFVEKTIDFGTSSVTLLLSDINGVGRLKLKPNANNTLNLPIPSTSQEIAEYTGHRLDVTIVPSNSEGRVIINASPYTLISSSSGIVTILTLVCTGTSWKALGFHV